jgi:ubiquitin carboxyl-terminal hydrolase 5/13
VYCYKCDELRLEPELHALLAPLGLKAGEKTEKSTAELQLEHNQNFQMFSEQGKMTCVYGEYLTGLRNIGNSCYMASVYQSLFAKRGLDVNLDSKHFETCQIADCLQCQLTKLVTSMRSGDYSKPNPVPMVVDGKEIKDDFQAGIPPTMLKGLVGKRNSEFGSGRQQDAYEYLSFFLTYVDTLGLHFEDQLTCGLVQRLECLECNGVKYLKQKSVGVQVSVFENDTLSKTLERFSNGEMISEFSCSLCRKKTNAKKYSVYGFMILETFIS